MAFTNEPIPVDKLQTFDFSVFSDHFGRPFKFPNYGQHQWTIDHEQDVFLIFTSAGGGMQVDSAENERYGVWCKGDVVHVEADLVLIKDAEGQLLTWDNAKLFVPPQLVHRRDEFITWIQQALNALGWHGNRSCVYSVIINFQ